MSLTLRAILLILTLLFSVAVVRMVMRGKLQLKYSLVWLLLSVALLVCALFPSLVSWFADLAGAELTSNFVFIMGFVFLIGVCLSLSVIVSWQARDIRSLVQQVALLQKEFEEREEARHGHLS